MRRTFEERRGYTLDADPTGAEENDMTPEEEKFAEHLAAQCKSHQEWLCIMRFGLKTLLDSPPIFMALLWGEMERRSGNGKADPDLLREYLSELGLKLAEESTP